MKISLADFVGDGAHTEAIDADEPKQRLVWHYTSADVFKSIIENHVIWASDVNNLNDSDEIRLGIKRFSKTLKARHDNFSSPKEQLEAAELSEVHSLIESWKTYPLYGSAFTVSFSRYGDDNSQWQRYAADATGVAIGIRQGAYMPVLGDEPSVGSVSGIIEDVPLYWTKMLYKRREQQDSIEYAVSEMLDSLSRNPSPDEDVDMSELIRDQALSAYSAAAASVKNKGFRAENEYRYVISRPHSASAIHTRPNGVPFVKITGGPADVDSDPRYRAFYQTTAMHLPIEKVRLGPKTNDTLGEVQDLLQQNGYTEVQVKKSRSTLQ